MAKYIGLDKLLLALSIVKENGGLRASLYKIFRMDALKSGTLIGCDKYGNKYYENHKYFYGRSRWIEYAPYYSLEYDASQVPAEWYGWLHYKTDLPPFKDPTRKNHPWMIDHTENMSGTSQQYVPYSTVLPKIHAWKPPNK